MALKLITRKLLNRAKIHKMSYGPTERKELAGTIRHYRKAMGRGAVKAFGGK